ncbi:Panacea domain-containing protein [Acidipropionibacterium timonense]|uniref:Panacea domain-containing protein n=1 Tax=Acidipropionibacterium timonense TaxID=2161818 RepID=UPI001436BED4|nr:Panacea domain-containing protein [Acidipropionibacterium timonense]
MTSVFDIAAEFIDRSGGVIETVKLQKLCFYAFGWYAHLTGEPLFGETFYAMEYGPVVGELLSAHAKQRTVGARMIQDQREARQDEREELDPYKKAVLDAVWAVYGDKDRWKLVDLTHEESVWCEAWDSRRPGTKRGDLAREDVIAYFLDRQPRSSEQLDLPPAMISRASADELTAIEAEAEVHRPFVDAVRAFRYAS